MVTLLMRFVCEIINLIHLKLFSITDTRCTMKADKYALKLNGTTVLVKGYRASVRMRVETPNAPVPRTTRKLLRTAGLVMNSCNYSQLAFGTVPS